MPDSDEEAGATPPKKNKVMYKCKYNAVWEKDFPWLKKGFTDFYAQCKLCNVNFSVSNRGINQVGLRFKFVMVQFL